MRRSAPRPSLPLFFRGSLYTQTGPFFVNVLDVTAVTMPIGFADKGVDVLDPTLEPLNEQDAKIAAQCT